MMMIFFQIDGKISPVACSSQSSPPPSSPSSAKESTNSATSTVVPLRPSISVPATSAPTSLPLPTSHLRPELVNSLPIPFSPHQFFNQQQQLLTQLFLAQLQNQGALVWIFLMISFECVCSVWAALSKSLWPAKFDLTLLFLLPTVQTDVAIWSVEKGGSGLLSKATVATGNLHLGKWIWKCSFSKLAFNFHCCEITCALQTLFESRFFTVIRGLCLDTCPPTDRQTSRQGDKAHRTICLLRVLTYRKRLWLSREREGERQQLEEAQKTQANRMKEAETIQKYCREKLRARTHLYSFFSRKTRESKGRWEKRKEHLRGREAHEHIHGQKMGNNH